MSNSRLLVVSLFDLTGVALEPWYKAGYRVLQIDLQLPAELTESAPSSGWFRSGADCFKAAEVIEQVRRATGTDVYFISCFPPCTELAVSGARWFESKRNANPTFQKEAMDLVYLSRDIIDDYDVAGYVENPISMISSFWRKPNYNFHPWHFTGISMKDNYTKKTCLWTSDKFEMPGTDVHPRVQEAVDLIVSYLGRFCPKPDALAWFEERALFATGRFIEEWYPDDRIHKAGPSVDRENFRSATPTGWSRAVMAVNS